MDRSLQNNCILFNKTLNFSLYSEEHKIEILRHENNQKFTFY